MGNEGGWDKEPPPLHSAIFYIVPVISLPWYHLIQEITANPRTIK